MILSKLLSNKLARKPAPARALYEAIVAAARRTTFYEDMGVPDTVDGRFDMIVLHLFVVLDRLKGEHQNLQQAITDEFFKDMDRSLREMGVGDLSVGKKVRKMAEAYAGRIQAYGEAAAKDDEALLAAVQRNVYANSGNSGAGRLVQTVRLMQAKLASQSANQLAQGNVEL
jgi:cytochrome b pre-mRNA-processing protein 3